MMPFFTYYGGKYRAAPHYDAPLFNTIVEPFAGAAGYSIRHYANKVILVDKDPKIAAIWRYLINVSSVEITKLPMIAMDENVSNLSICEEAKYLIGFWLNKGTAQPSKSPSKWMRSGVRPNSYWSEAIRERIASQVDAIRHWQIYEGDYRNMNNGCATWFIDPPYQLAGNLYKCSAKDINFTELGEWCKSRKGQVIVCENDGATWLPFTHFKDIKSTPGKNSKLKSAEAIYKFVSN